MSTLFRPRPGHFEKKSQSLPNAIFFNPNLTDAGIRLIGVLNAMFTSGGKWVPSQADIMNRLGWGKEKMKGAKDNLVDNGYLKVTQYRDLNPSTRGQFSPNVFEFDIDGSYNTDNQGLKNEEPEKPSHKPFEPRADIPPAAPSPAASRPLHCSKKEPYLKEQTNTGSWDEDDPKIEVTEQVVVVSSDHDDDFIKASILGPYAFTETVLDSLMCISLAQIEQASEAYNQFCERLKKKGDSVQNPEATFRKAIIEKWKPNVPKKSFYEVEEEKASSRAKTIEQNTKIARKHIEDYDNYFNDEFSVIMGEGVVYLKSSTGMACVSMTDPNFQKIIDKYVFGKLLEWQLD